ncbi:TetR/AcrR family transcriptional regulator [Streptomyces subrutilus]|uniref:TetR family transcriptional regulator n=1 Tax=Streptomyces subrutilus TaxID=36818 RepID=A0A1E5PVG9_9ACTN|nr:TetR/AcrR family transcriptional regulator [Streptomyces subrutilus]OEJ33511.1 TetR family transcriptional regulator [Streptomyces subrutilus]
MDDEEARTRLLDAAEALFYADGIQAVGMDRVRAESGVPLKRLYRLYPAKESLVAAYLERRDERWMTSLRRAVTEAAKASASLGPGPSAAPVLAVFDWLAAWFCEPDFRGCAFLNAYGELGARGPAPILDVVRRHKARLRSLLADLTGPAEEALADQLLILVEGATVTAALDPGPAPAHRAREVAERLIRSLSPPSAP